MKFLTWKQTFWVTAGLTLAIEAVTALFRFGLGLEATRSTASTVGVLTHGIRIHHGYIGVLVLAVAWGLLESRPALARWLIVIGGAMAATDLIHHFVVLMVVTGDPGFDFAY